MMVKNEPKTDMLSKGLHLLLLLGDAPKGARTADLARLADLPFNTTYRLLKGLTKEGFAHYEPEGRLYHLGLQIFQLGQRVSHAHGFAGVAQPILEKVTSQTLEATIMAVQYGMHQLTVSKVDGPHAFRLTSDAGHQGPLHSTALGKVLVAFADEAESERLISELELTPRTEHTITDRDAFRREIEKVRAQGFAAMDEENELGMHAIAVPVLAQGGRAIAAVATAAPVFRLTMDGLKAHLPALRRAAEELAVRLPQL